MAVEIEEEPARYPAIVEAEYSRGHKPVLGVVEEGVVGRRFFEMDITRVNGVLVKAQARFVVKDSIELHAMADLFYRILSGGVNESIIKDLSAYGTVTVTYSTMEYEDDEAYVERLTIRATPG